MTMMDAFYMLYKTNAKEAVKEHKEVEDQVKKTKQGLKDASDQSDMLADSLEGVAKIMGSYIGYSFLKGQLTQAIDLNTQLALMSKLYQQQGKDLAGLAQAASLAGGSYSGALSNIAGLSMQASAANRHFDPIAHLQNARRYVQSRPEASRAYAAAQVGYTDPGLVRMLTSATDADFKKFIEEGYTTRPRTQEDLEKGLKSTENINSVVGTLSTYFTQLNNVLQPVISGFSQLANAMGQAIASSSAATGVTSGLSLLGGWVGGKALWNFVRGGAAVSGGANAAAGAAGGASLLSGLGIFAGLGALGYDIYGGTALLYEAIGKKMAGISDTNPNADYSLGGTKMGAVSQSMQFWQSQGLDKAHAAAITANMMRESGGRPEAVGDSGQAIGLFQWHPDRRKSILDATGIDVTTAGFEDQLKAAAWEMQNGRPGFSSDTFKSIDNTSLAAGYFSSKYETPANLAYEAAVRGNMAMQIADRYSNTVGAAASTTQQGDINIGKVEVHTQATDAHGISQALTYELGNALGKVQGNFDDGVAK